MTNDQVDNLLQQQYIHERRIRIGEQMKARKGLEWSTTEQLELESDQRSLRMVKSQLRVLQAPIRPEVLVVTDEDGRFVMLEGMLLDLADTVETALTLFQKQISAEQRARIKGQWSLRIILGLLTAAIVWLALR